MTNEAGSEGGHFWYKWSLNFTKFSIKKRKKGGKQRDEGKLPTDYQYKWSAKENRLYKRVTKRLP